MWHMDNETNKVLIVMIELNSEIKHSREEMDRAQMSNAIIGFCDKTLFIFS